MILIFDAIPNEHVAEYCEGILDCLGKLGYDWDYEETSPPDKDNEVTFKVIGIKKE